MNDINTVCKSHSGIVTDIKNIKDINLAQWREINGMKKFIIGTLATAVITLGMVVINLLITLAAK